MNERIKELRKHLSLTLEQFGQRIGVTKMTISRIENGKNAITEQMFKSICREFNVNEEWLRNGTGSMFVQPDTFSLDEFVKSRGATELELEIVKTYFELDPTIRKKALEFFKCQLASAITENPVLLVPDNPKDLENICPPVEDDNEQSNIG